MKRDEAEDRETHHNQVLTEGARRLHKRAFDPPPGGRRKMVVIHLNDREHAALGFLGGPAALKNLLCPAGLCIRCRQNGSVEHSFLNSLCTSCQTIYERTEEPRPQ